MLYANGASGGIGGRKTATVMGPNDRWFPFRFGT